MSYSSRLSYSSARRALKWAKTRKLRGNSHRESRRAGRPLCDCFQCRISPEVKAGSGAGHPERSPGNLIWGERLGLGQQLLAGLAKFVQARRRFGFDVTPNEWFGAAGAECHPLTFGQEVFVAVSGDKSFDLKGSDGRQTRSQFSQERFLGLRLNGDVDAVAV